MSSSSQLGDKGSTCPSHMHWILDTTTQQYISIHGSQLIYPISWLDKSTPTAMHIFQMSSYMSRFDWLADLLLYNILIGRLKWVPQCCNLFTVTGLHDAGLVCFWLSILFPLFFLSFGPSFTFLQFISSHQIVILLNSDEGVIPETQFDAFSQHVIRRRLSKQAFSCYVAWAGATESHSGEKSQWENSCSARM